MFITNFNIRDTWLEGTKFYFPNVCFVCDITWIKRALRFEKKQQKNLFFSSCKGVPRKQVLLKFINVNLSKTLRKMKILGSI